MKSLTLLVLLLTTNSAFAGNSVLEALQPRAGLYTVTANDAANPCRLPREVAAGAAVRLDVRVAEEDSEFETKGDTIVDLQQHFDNIDTWGTLFDRAAFKYINKGTRRAVVGMVISHQSLLDIAKNRLSHSVTLTAWEGGSEAVQVIEFNDAEKKIVYTYEIRTRNRLGFTTKTEQYGRCEFTRKE